MKGSLESIYATGELSHPSEWSREYFDRLEKENSADYEIKISEVLQYLDSGGGYQILQSEYRMVEQFYQFINRPELRRILLMQFVGFNGREQYYHNFDHVIESTLVAYTLGRMIYPNGSEQLYTLVAAMALHDVGYLYGNGANHEEIGVHILQSTAHHLELDPHLFNLDRCCELILSTRVDYGTMETKGLVQAYSDPAYLLVLLADFSRNFADERLYSEIPNRLGAEFGGEKVRQIRKIEDIKILLNLLRVLRSERMENDLNRREPFLSITRTIASRLMVAIPLLVERVAVIKGTTIQDDNYHVYRDPNSYILFADGTMIVSPTSIGKLYFNSTYTFLNQVAQIMLELE